MQRSFLNRTIICLIPVVISVWLIVRAYYRDPENWSGFKQGIDLSGGTILVYEIDQELSKQVKGRNDQDDAGATGRARADSKLADAIKRRIDGNDLKGIIVRAIGDSRVEIIMPYGSRAGSNKEAINSGDVDKIKQMIAEVGSLEFRIGANSQDDAEAIRVARDYFKKAAEDPSSAEAASLAAAARTGTPPPFPNRGADEEPFRVMDEAVRYEWVEIGKRGRPDRELASWQNADQKSRAYQEFEGARARNNGVLESNTGAGDRGEGTTSEMLYSRESKNERNPKESEAKKFDYFMLTRVSDKDRVQVGGEVTIRADVTDGNRGGPAVGFTFNSAGGDRFFQVTNRNKPSSAETGVPFYRKLAIVLDGDLISSPTVNSAIRNSGVIEGRMNRDEVARVVELLRSGALPATLKRLPVSENTIGPTLGADTIRSGRRAVVLAFVAILVFMIIYYRFAGFVATVALLANLLLTVGFMLAFSATFTLPGLAGLVLMLGMAVDANVLIYERVREERDRGMNLMTALRNGYDRALPTIIDTHLSSIFTAIVLYAVGNDQLKGFGVSLTVGLVISLFTSLFMTRLLFDYWQAKNWLKQLRMLRFFSRPNINFMGIRKAMFTTTAVLTVLGLAIFLGRGRNGLNVDFVGGTAYSGSLKKPLEIGALRKLLDEKRQETRLKVEGVEELGGSAGSNRSYTITYADDKLTNTVSFANPPKGNTKEEREADVKVRAGRIPDWSVEQVFTAADTGSGSTIFNVRTTEREPELVLASITRLFVDDAGATLLNETTCDVSAERDDWVMKFGAPVSRSLVKTLVEREFQRRLGPDYTASDVFDVIERGEQKDGRYQEMLVKVNSGAPGMETLLREKDAARSVMTAAAKEFSAKPQPERLETFDGTLASETRSRALYAIIASWVAILLYLWFRFGNWTFGAAAVICLIHDLCFTLGMIAVCYYVHDTFIGQMLGLQDFKIDLPAVAALLTLVGYSVNDTIVVFDRIREVRGKNPALTAQMINDSVNQTLSRTVLASFTTFLVVIVLYMFGGEGVHLFAFVMVIGVMVGTYSSIYIASPLLLIFGEGKVRQSYAETAAVKPA